MLLIRLQRILGLENDNLSHEFSEFKNKKY